MYAGEPHSESDQATLILSSVIMYAGEPYSESDQATLILSSGIHVCRQTTL